jgi:hypothetical protein
MESSSLSVVVYLVCAGFFNPLMSRPQNHVTPLALPLNALGEHDGRNIVLSLVWSLMKCVDSKRRSNDAVNQFMIQLFDFGEQLKGYSSDAVHDDKPVISKLLHVELLPVMKLLGKNNYVDLFAMITETLYQNMRTPTREEAWLNQFVRMSVSKGTVGMDVYCEFLNLWMKR